MQKRNGAYFFHKHVLKLNVRYSSAENSNTMQRNVLNVYTFDEHYRNESWD